jgi:hypothetical protein
MTQLEVLIELCTTTERINSNSGNRIPLAKPTVVQLFNKFPDFYISQTIVTF